MVKLNGSYDRWINLSQNFVLIETSLNWFERAYLL